MTTVGIIVADTETTGLDYTEGVNVPWEIGWIGAWHDFDAETVTCLPTARQFQLHLTEKQLADASPAGLRVGKFEERYTFPGPEADQVMKDALIADCVALATETRATPHWVGANPTFDYGMMVMGGKHFTYAQWNRNFAYRMLDIQALAAGALKWHSVGLNRIAERFGIEQAGAHEALDDALTTIRCYAACYGAKLIGLDEAIEALSPTVTAPKAKPIIDDDW